MSSQLLGVETCLRKFDALAAALLAALASFGGGPNAALVPHRRHIMIRPASTD